MHLFFIMATKWHENKNLSWTQWYMKALLMGPCEVFLCENQKTWKKLSVSHACARPADPVRSSDRLQFLNDDAPSCGTDPKCQPADSSPAARGPARSFVPLWLSRLRDNSADNSWDRRLSLSHRDVWFPPSAWSHGLPRAFSPASPGAQPRTSQPEPRQQSLRLSPPVPVARR